MCLIIHKPASVALPEDLLASAVEFNPHGFGIMTFDDAGGIDVRRRADTRLPELLRLCADYADLEYVIHLRYRTRGEIDLANTQPLRITPHIYLAHNGTVALEAHTPARSDTWHLIEDYLCPILQHRPAVLYERSFQDLIGTWTGPHNRFVFMDAERRQTVIVNRAAGFDLDGLWLSNTRWFDGSRFAWYRRAMAGEQRQHRVTFYL